MCGVFLFCSVLFYWRTPTSKEFRKQDTIQKPLTKESEFHWERGSKALAIRCLVKQLAVVNIYFIFFITFFFLSISCVQSTSHLLSFSTGDTMRCYDVHIAG